ncbi:MAG TPA: anti-sigma factor [Gammaproteobacteria bacterium]|nr:anti-sigma factor [Gammaproteobacteria bacterium]
MKNLSNIIASTAAHAVAQDAAPWVPLSAGKAFQPLQFFGDDRGFVELLRLEPGCVMPLHRHTGEVHVFNVEGSRRLDSGESVGPGGYVYEPAGNVDSWEVVGDSTLVALTIVHGAVEYLDAGGTVIERFTANTLRDIYLRYCLGNGIKALDLLCD